MDTRKFIFEPAARSKMKLLIGMFGLSGGGKTLSSLLVARGIVGPSGKIALADTENKRGTVYKDMVPGGFLHLDFQPPFHPLAYCDMIDAAEDAGIDCLCVDSTSHEWGGLGGYLDLKEEALQQMAGNDWQKREKCAMAAAARVKPHTHSKFIQRMLRSRMSLILCFRAHPKVRLSKGEDGKSKIEVDETPSPMQDGELIYEMMIAGECYSINGVGGYFRVSGPHCKHSHPDILKLLPQKDEQIGQKHGEALAKWCARSDDAGTVKTTPAATTNIAGVVDAQKTAKAKLWKLLIPVRGPESTWTVAESWLRVHGIIKDGETISQMSAEQLAVIIEKSETELSK